MGEKVERREFTREDRQRYRQKVQRCLDVFERMLRESRFDAHRPLTGIEIELNLVQAGGDDAGDPAMVNAEVLGLVADPMFQTELGQFNIEINVEPRRLGGTSLQSLEDDIRVYGVDISTADIEIMTAEGSPWVATATTDPSAIGAAVVRVMALELAGEVEEREVVFPGTLVTQEFLREEGIANLEALRGVLPELSMTDVATADWITPVSF